MKNESDKIEPENLSLLPIYKEMIIQYNVSVNRLSDKMI